MGIRKLKERRSKKSKEGKEIEVAAIEIEFLMIRIAANRSYKFGEKKCGEMHIFLCDSA